MKSEPSVYSIDDLIRDGKTCWDGVRNFQARNFIRDRMRPGDLVLFYHSSAEPSGAAGIARVCRSGYPDFTAWDKKGQHYDPRSKKDKPLWFMIDVEFVGRFPHFVSLDRMRSEPALKEMLVLKRGARLSVQPVAKEHFEIVKGIGTGEIS